MNGLQAVEEIVRYVRRRAARLTAGWAVLAVLPVLLLIAADSGLPQRSLGRFGRSFVVNQEPQPSDAIVVLLGDELRLSKAAELYHSGLAPRLVFGTGYIGKSGRRKNVFHSAGRRYLDGLEKRDVPRSAMTLVPTAHAYDTAHELDEIGAYLRSQRVHRVLLVSSASHTARLAVIWDRVAPDIDRRVVAVQPESLSCWWYNPRAIYEVAYESGAFVKEGWAQLRAFVKRDLVRLARIRTPRANSAT